MGLTKRGQGDDDLGPEYMWWGSLTAQCFIAITSPTFTLRRRPWSIPLLPIILTNMNTTMGCSIRLQTSTRHTTPRPPPASARQHPALVTCVEGESPSATDRKPATTDVPTVARARSAAPMCTSCLVSCVFIELIVHSETSKPRGPSKAYVASHSFVPRSSR